MLVGIFNLCLLVYLISISVTNLPYFILHPVCIKVHKTL